jgi:hypothetical protein
MLLDRPKNTLSDFPVFVCQKIVAISMRFSYYSTSSVQKSFSEGYMSYTIERVVQKGTRY